MLISRSDGTTAQTVLPSTSASLQHALWRSAERLCRLEADAVGVWIVIVAVQRESHAELFERLRRAGGFGHRLNALLKACPCARVPCRGHKFSGDIKGLVLVQKAEKAPFLLA